MRGPSICGISADEPALRSPAVFISDTVAVFVDAGSLLV
jgi:hypothetical protein